MNQSGVVFRTPPERTMIDRTLMIQRRQIPQNSIQKTERVVRRKDYLSTTAPNRNLYITTRNNFLIELPHMKKQQAQSKPRRKLALLIAAHNEELVIEQQIRSAIRAGMPKQYIYVVDDNSTDSTSKIVKSIISPKNVLKVKRSGKGLALTKAIKKFQLTKNYQWVHIADADGGFSPDYFKVFRSQLNPKYAAATGYIRSIPGGSVSAYRVVEYTLGMEIQRRFQSTFNTITVIPGPTSCFRSDVLSKLDFANKTITEDFDVTLQLHRQKLGKIQFIPDAVAFTQDPRNLSDLVKQLSRWNRGIMQGMKRHRVGFHPTRIDAYLMFQVLQNLFFFVNYFALLPILAITLHSTNVFATTFIFDVAIVFFITFFVAMKARRWDIISAFPQIYMYRWVSMFVFMRSFIEVVILGKYKPTHGTWGTAGRRYKQSIPI
jgi:cellulose synthase/poly-beta-1,6-N-acetylglucosamine synthase-like glycosyltransferase